MNLKISIYFLGITIFISVFSIYFPPNVISKGVTRTFDDGDMLTAETCFASTVVLRSTMGHGAREAIPTASLEAVEDTTQKTFIQDSTIDENIQATEENDRAEYSFSLHEHDNDISSNFDDERDNNILSDDI